MQGFADLAFSAVVQPAQASFFRRGLSGKAVQFQQGQHIVAQRPVYACNDHGEFVVFTGFGSDGSRRSGQRQAAQQQSSQREAQEE